MMNRQQLFGKKSESEAISYLKKNGYKILEKNFRTRFGEIDIIAIEKDVIVFVEVKSRKSLNYGDPKESVNLRKQRKISKVALYYLKKNNLFDCSARFDVITIRSFGKSNEIELIKNGFELVG